MIVVDEQHGKGPTGQYHSGKYEFQLDEETPLVGGGNQQRSGCGARLRYEKAKEGAKRECVLSARQA